MRSISTKRALAATALIATVSSVALVGYTAHLHQRERKIEVYQAFFQSWADEEPVNLGEKAKPHNVSFRAVRTCAPTVAVTARIAGIWDQPQFRPGDFPPELVRLVDPDVQRLRIEENDPLHARTSAELEQQLDAAFNVGLMRVSDVAFSLSGDRAMFTASFVCGSLCGYNAPVLMEKRDGAWAVSENDCGDFIIY